MQQQYLIHYDDGYLAHYGVLGMKWGHRKSKSSKKDAIKSMTTKDLERKVHRTKLENEYRYQNRSKAEKSKEVVQKILIGAAGAAAGFVAKDLAKSGITVVRRYMASSAATKTVSKTAEYIWDLA